MHVTLVVAADIALPPAAISKLHVHITYIHDEHGSYLL